MNVLFSQPTTLPGSPQVPEHFHQWASERALSYAYGQRYPRRVSEYVFRSCFAMSLFRKRNRFDAVVTGRYGELFAALQGLWPFGKKPLLLLDVEWPHRQSRYCRRLASKLFHRLIARGAWKIQVFCHAEADNYAAYFGIERDRFVWIPYCTEVEPAMYPARAGDYIFTGGVHQRDYETLCRAIGDLPIPVRIAAPAERVDSRLLGPQMKLLGTLPRQDFFNCMAGARLVVLSLQDGLLRCPGVITYVTAMRLGKCVIVNDPRGATSYIVNGQTGTIVPARDAGRLRDAVRELWDDPWRQRAQAENAREFAAEHFTTARYFADLERLTRQATDRNLEATCPCS